MADLPEEIVFVIFSKLPTKSAGKCKCLSTYWHTRLSTPQFINLHLKNRKTHNQEIKNIFVLTSTHNIFRIITSPLNNNVSVISKQIQYPPNTLRLYVVGSCNGLLLLSNNDKKMFMLNPITLQQLNVPYQKKFEPIDVFGFGYDPSCDDYKVVKLNWTGGENIVSFGVYSMRRGVWKNVDNVPCHLIPTHAYYPMAFVNGAVHWLATIKGRSMIAGFDLEYEVIREIPLYIDFCKVCWSRIAVLKGCICIIVHDFRNCTIDMWMMQEYGIVDSWVRYRIVDSWVRYHIQTNNRWMMIIEPLCFVNDYEFLYLNNAGSWKLHNVKEQTTKDVVVGGVSGYLKGASVFVDSLVSLDQYVVSG